MWAGLGQSHCISLFSPGVHLGLVSPARPMPAVGLSTSKSLCPRSSWGGHEAAVCPSGFVAGAHLHRSLYSPRKLLAIFFLTALLVFVTTCTTILFSCWSSPPAPHNYTVSCWRARTPTCSLLCPQHWNTGGPQYVWVYMCLNMLTGSTIRTLWSFFSHPLPIVKIISSL